MGIPRIDVAQMSYSLIIALLYVLLVGAVAQAQVAPAPGQDEGPMERTELVITYTRDETPRDEVAGDITVVTKKDMEKMPAVTAAEVLQNVPGVFVSFSGGPGSFAAANIQGCMDRQVAVYQDGVPLGMFANPVTDLSAIPVNIIDRIEVYKGAASSVWGSAMGGVINIITREPDSSKPFTGNISASGGEDQTAKGSAAFAGTMDRMGYFMAASHNSSSDFVPHTRYWDDSAYGKVNYALGSSSRLSFVYSYDEGKSEMPFPNFWDALSRQRSYQRILSETKLSDAVTLTLEGRHQLFDTSILDNFDAAGLKSSYFVNYSEMLWGTSARLSYRESANTLGVGFDGDWGQYDFNQYSTTYDSGNWAVYANDTYRLGRLALNGGLRLDNNIDFGSAISPSGGAVYSLPWMNALVRMQIAKGFSAPPGAWVNDPRAGNKDLKPETAMNYQLGGEVQPFQFLKLTAGLFLADVDNLIRAVPVDPVHFVNKFENVDRAIRKGFEVDASARLTSTLTLNVGGSYIDVRDDRTGEAIKDIPRVLYNASLSYSYERMSHSIVGRYVDNNSSHPETHDKVFVFDYLFKYRLPLSQQSGAEPVTLFAAIYDLTDSGYLYRTSFPQPGRRFEGGMSFHF